MLVKFWDLDTRHCFKTIVSHRSEVNDLILINDDERLITGCHDNELRVFEIKLNKEMGQNFGKEKEPNLKRLKLNEDQEEEDDDNEDNADEEESDLSTSILECKLIGSLIRESKDPLTQMCFDPTMSVFTAHSSNEKQLELYKINSEEEIKKRLAKKLKKQKRKVASEQTEAQKIDNEIFSIEQTVNGNEITF
jgi:U3 small nucleolar RNA-associated protein 12